MSTESDGRWAVVGFDVEHRLGCGWAGEVWAARGRATGRPVVLRRLVLPPDAAARARMRAAADVLVGLEHPHLVRLRGAVSTSDALVLVVDRVRGRPLPGLVAECGGLDPVTVARLAVPLARALAAVHDRGLVHGHLTASAVFVGDDGRPLLDETGLAGLLGDGPAEEAAADVRALAGLCHSALAAAHEGSELAAVLAAATGPTDARTAPELASAVLGCAFPAPAATPTLRSGPAVEQPHRRRSHRRRPPAPRARRPAGWRRWAGALLVVAAGVLATLTGLAWAGADDGSGPVVARHGRSPSAVSPSHRPAVDPSWRGVLAALDRSRAAAFAAPSLRRLTEVYVAGSPAGRRDRARLSSLLESGARLTGLRLHPVAVAVASRSPDRVVLEVVDVLGPSELRSAGGRVLQRLPGRAETSWTITLARVGAGWRFYDVVRR